VKEMSKLLRKYESAMAPSGAQAKSMIVMSNSFPDVEWVNLHGRFLTWTESNSMTASLCAVTLIPHLVIYWKWVSQNMSREQYKTANLFMINVIKE